MTQEATNKILMILAVLAVLASVQKLLGGKKHSRCRQYPDLVASLVYGAAALVFCIVKAADIAAWFTEKEILAECPIIAVNLAILAGFCLIKGIMRLVLMRHEPGIGAQNYYEYNAREDVWLLRADWINFGKVLGWAAAAAAVGTAAALAVIYRNTVVNGVTVHIYPTVMMLVFIETANFFLGEYDLEEVLRSISGADSNRIHISRYFKLVDILKKLFPGELLSSHFGCEFMNRSGAYDLLKKLRGSDDRADKLCAVHFGRLVTEKELNADSIIAVTKMLKGKSVIFTNTFYRDNSDYIALPLIDALVSNKKCLVIAGRSSGCADITEWIGEMLQEHCRMRSLWSVKELGCEAVMPDVGVLSAKSIYDLRMLEANTEFFREVRFVIMQEPSTILTTGQVGLNIISEEMERGTEKPVFCICDRKADGLTDTLSHILHTELVEVAATPVPRSTYSALLWDADGDYARQRLFEKQTQYLGGGTEIAATAIRNQIPEVTWYSETKTPMKDVQWLAGQNYAAICKYMHQPVQQKSIDEKIAFVPGLWSRPPEEDQFIIVDDEFCNMFATLKMFLARDSKQLFVNVLSENYLLRDYMRCNREMFANDPNAVPSLVPAYAKTERNTVLELILKMAFRPVSEKEIMSELLLTGIESEDVFPIFTGLVSRYTGADDSLLTVRTRVEPDDSGYSTGSNFTISDREFDRFFSKTIKNAYYLVEDEVGNTEYINAKQYGHIVQTILPGQFVTYDGKYYEVKYISPSSGVVLRRASAVYAGREYYRQLRKYTLHAPEGDRLVSSRRVMDFEVSVMRMNLAVETDGYLVMKSNDDLCGARVVDFSADPMCGDLKREYRNKNVLVIRIPETAERVRYTFCVLLSELFRTLFPDGWPYLAVLTPIRENVEGMLNYLLYQSDGELEEDCIYIVEDSELDLGLLEAVERNLREICEIINDYLEWHMGKIRESAYEDPDKKNLTLPRSELSELERRKKRRGLLANLKKQLAVIFGTKKVKSDPPKKKNGETEPTEGDDTGNGGTDNGGTGNGGNDNSGTGNGGTDSGARKYITLPETGFEPPDNEKVQKSEKTDNAKSEALAESNEPAEICFAPVMHTAEDEKSAVEGSDNEKAETEPTGGDAEKAEQKQENIDSATTETEIFVNNGDDYIIQEFWDNVFTAAGICEPEKSRYQQECYLKFGFEEIDSRFELAEVIAMLRSRGFYDSAIKKARKRNPFEEKILAGKKAENHCDFCGEPINGISFDRLNDGRIRCSNCTATAITSVEEFTELYENIVELMKGYFHIDFSVPVRVVTADAETIAAANGRIFIPSTGVAPRAVGFARKQGKKLSVVIENGSPRLACVDTIIHEMTHIWQYLNWDRDRIAEIYYNPDMPDVVDMVYEGMAVWASVQFLYEIGEIYHAAVMEAEYEARDDIYGKGFLYYRSKYPFIKNSDIISNSPFNTFPPL